MRRIRGVFVTGDEDERGDSFTPGCLAAIAAATPANGGFVNLHFDPTLPPTGREVGRRLTEAGVEVTIELFDTPGLEVLCSFIEAGRLFAALGGSIVKSTGTDERRVITEVRDTHVALTDKPIGNQPPVVFTDTKETK